MHKYPLSPSIIIYQLQVRPCSKDIQHIYENTPFLFTSREKIAFFFLKLFSTMARSLQLTEEEENLERESQRKKERAKKTSFLNINCEI